MQNNNYYRQKKKNSNIITTTLIISWIIILGGIWRLFFADNTKQPTNLIDDEQPTQENNDATRYYIGEKILAEGTISSVDGFGTYTHNFVSQQGETFGLKSAEIDLYQYSGSVQIKGEVIDIQKETPIIMVEELLASRGDTAEVAEVEGNPNYYLFRQQGLGFDLSISDGYEVQQQGENLVLVDSETGNTELLSIAPFACDNSDPLADCVSMKQRFTEYQSDSFTSSNDITFYHLSESSTWVAFNGDQYGYYVRPVGEAELTSFVQFMSFINEATFDQLIEDNASTICRDIEHRMNTINKVSYNYLDDGIVDATIEGSSDAGAELRCVVAIRLGSVLTTTLRSFTVLAGEAAELPTPDDDTPEEADDTVDEPADEVEVEEEEQQEDDEPENLDDAIEPTAQGDRPDSFEGWMPYESVRGYTVYFSTNTVSYAGEIMSPAEDLGIAGATCTYKINGIYRQNADDVDTNPDVTIYECGGDFSTASLPAGVQTVGTVDDLTFLAVYKTTNLSSTRIFVE